MSRRSHSPTVAAILSLIPGLGHAYVERPRRGLFVAIPAVWMFNYFTGKIESFDVEMGNSSSELIDYFLKRSQRGAGVRK